MYEPSSRNWERAETSCSVSARSRRRSRSRWTTSAAPTNAQIQVGLTATTIRCASCGGVCGPWFCPVTIITANATGVAKETTSSSA
ncbi:MAG: hypothetical protein WCP53_07310 [Verrucomicrobiota bacterium]